MLNYPGLGGKSDRLLDLFVKVMGDMKIGEIDEEIAGAYFQTLKKLPANISRVKAYREKSISELLAMKAMPQSEVTCSQKIERASAMFKWALTSKRKWGIDTNPFVGFGQDNDNPTTRRPFTMDELRALLSHPDFVNKSFVNSYAFLLIPLATYTGARLGELCQLDLKDFVTIDDIPCIDINDVDGESVGEGERKKSVKTKKAKRLVPIHPELIRIGILRHVERMRARREKVLFPELNRERRDGPGQAASNWFGRFRQKVGIATKQATVFHSFRHLFITGILDKGLSPHMVAPIVGHEAGLVTGNVYWNTKDASKRLPTVESFSLPDDVTCMFPNIEDVIFSAPRGRRTKNNRPSPISLT